METEHGSSRREERMAELILSVSAAKHNASSVSRGPLSQASLEQTPAPACSKHIPSVCKHRDHDQIHEELKHMGHDFRLTALFPQAGLACPQKGIRNYSAVVMGLKGPQENPHTSHESSLRALEETSKFT